MSRDDCPICGDGQHYVPQGCIRALVAKVQALTARVEELELGHALPVIDEGSIYLPEPRIGTPEYVQWQQNRNRETAALLDAMPIAQSSPSVTIATQSLMAHEPHKVTQSERMKEVWRQRRAAKT